MIKFDHIVKSVKANRWQSFKQNIQGAQIQSSYI